VARSGGASGDVVLAEARARLADDLDTVGAIAAIDAWAADPATTDTAAPALVRDLADALLGIAL